MKTRKHNHIDIQIGCTDCWNDNEPSHTPTPWKVVTGRETLSIQSNDENEIYFEFPTSPLGTANAAFIVKAVNAYENDQKIKEDLVDLIKRLNYAFYVDGTSKALKPIMAETKALIAKAEGR